MKETKNPPCDKCGKELKIHHGDEGTSCFCCDCEQANNEFNKMIKKNIDEIVNEFRVQEKTHKEEHNRLVKKLYKNAGWKLNKNILFNNE